jgi:hypothetical protein
LISQDVVEFPALPKEPHLLLSVFDITQGNAATFFRKILSQIPFFDPF